MGATHSMANFSRKTKRQRGVSLPQGLDRARSEAILRSTRSEMSLSEMTVLFDDQKLRSAASVPCIYHHLRKERSDKTFWPLHTNQALFLPEFPIKLKDTHMFQPIKMIGKGAFGKVFQVRTTQGNREFALKRLDKSKILEEDALEQCKEEVLLQVDIGDHPFILALDACWQSRGHLYFLAEYMNNGDLYSLWRKWQVLPMSSVKIITLELGLALEYLHDFAIIFRDLKLENILIDAEGHIKLTDFGLAKQLTDSERTYTICGTLRYMAPEVLSGNGYSYEADWWSLGVVAYVLLVGEYPFGVAFDHKQMSKVIQDTKVLMEVEFSDDLHELVKGMLDVSPNTRICSLDELKTIQLFSGIDIDDVYDRKISPLDVLIEDLPRSSSGLLESPDVLQDSPVFELF